MQHPIYKQITASTKLFKIYIKRILAVTTNWLNILYRYIINKGKYCHKYFHPNDKPQPPKKIFSPLYFILLEHVFNRYIIYRLSRNYDDDNEEYHNNKLDSSECQPKGLSLINKTQVLSELK